MSIIKETLRPFDFKFAADENLKVFLKFLKVRSLKSLLNISLNSNNQVRIDNYLRMRVNDNTKFSYK